MLAQGAGRLLSGPHPDRARADAELLLMHLLGKDHAGINRAWLIAHSSDDLGFENWKPYYEYVRRRNIGEPVQYITGEQEFYGLPFRVTPDVLIPRPETEHLVEKALELVASVSRSEAKGFVSGYDFSRAETSPQVDRALAPANSSPLRILDVGTGSGAIAVSLAHQLSRAHITAIDISPAALDIARGNAQRNGVSSRIRFLESDLLAAVELEKFKVVVSNPPYIPTADRASLSVEVREHEPGLALFAGEDGLDVYRRLIPAALAALEPGGWLLMEIGFGQADAIARLMSEAGFEKIEFVPDLQMIPRVACGRRTA